MTVTKTISGAGREEGYGVGQTADGGFVATGPTNSFGSGDNDFLLIRIDPNGDLIYAKTYGKQGDQYSRFVEVANDGGFVITGYSDYSGVLSWSDTDIYLVKTDSLGNSDCSSDVTALLNVDTAYSILSAGAIISSGIDVFVPTASQTDVTINSCDYCDTTNDITIIYNYSYTPDHGIQRS